MCGGMRIGSRWVETAGVEWVTPEDPQHAFPSPPKRTVFFDRLNEVIAAGRMEATVPAKERADEQLIKSN